MVATRLVTVEELEQIADDDRHVELVEGVIVDVSPTKEGHGDLAGAIAVLLGSHVRAHRLGKIDVGEPGFVVARLAPDAAFVAASRLAPDRRRDQFLPFAPDLAIEVEWPGNTMKELRRKAVAYLNGGGTTVWIIRPDRRQVVVIRTDHPEVIVDHDGVLEGEPAVPGFRLPLAVLFEDW